MVNNININIHKDKKSRVILYYECDLVYILLCLLMTLKYFVFYSEIIFMTLHSNLQRSLGLVNITFPTLKCLNEPILSIDNSLS